MATPRRSPPAVKTKTDRAKKPVRPRSTRRAKERSEDDRWRTIDRIIERRADALRQMD